MQMLPDVPDTNSSTILSIILQFTLLALEVKNKLLVHLNPPFFNVHYYYEDAFNLDAQIHVH